MKTVPRYDEKPTEANTGAARHTITYEGRETFQARCETCRDERPHAAIEGHWTCAVCGTERRAG